MIDLAFGALMVALFVAGLLFVIGVVSSGISQDRIEEERRKKARSVGAALDRKKRKD